MTTTTTPTGRAVRSARQNMGISQTELARRAGLNAATISRLESGARRSLSAPTASAIARALGVSIESLIHPPASRRRA